MSTALLVVDVQNDFCEGGALAVPGGARVAREITDLIRSENYSLIVASRDYHRALPDLNGGHFAAPGSEPNYTTTWPVHCVQGTAGAAYHPDLILPPTTLHVIKGMGRPDYSAFQGETNDFARQPLGVALRARGVTDIDVVGIATEHCVAASAFSGREEDFRVRVMADLTAGLDAARIEALLTSEFPAEGIAVRR